MTNNSISLPLILPQKVQSAYVSEQSVEHTNICTYIPYTYMYIHNSLISPIDVLLAGPDPNTFIAVTVTLTSLSTAGKSNVAIGTSTRKEPVVILSP